jgi:hypothetical protein
MALPALGIVARLLLSKGTREAVKKYGRAAVDKAKKELDKRNVAIDKKAAKVARAEGRTPSRIKEQAARHEAGKQRSREGLRTRLDRQQAEGPSRTIE